jgi:SUMO ligase MMS21 Smc5/6 complex component
LPEDGDVSDDDDDEVQIGGATQDFKCPLTLRLMEDALTSRVCKHSFSTAAIHEFLKRGPQKCPASGCQHRISKADLYEDKALRIRVRAAQRRAEMRQNEAGDAAGVDAVEVDSD